MTQTQPSAPQFLQLPLDQIQIKRETRQRKVIEVKDLVSSIRTRGVLQPIIVNEEEGEEGRYVLVAGERRLTACLELGLASIPARLLSSLDPIEAQIVELEENIKRSDLCWQDLSRAVGGIHRLYKSQDPDWTMTATAEALGITLGHASMQIRVDSELGDPRISACSNIREAYNLLTRRDQRASGEALQELLDTAQALMNGPKGEAPDLTQPELGLPEPGPGGDQAQGEASVKYTSKTLPVLRPSAAPSTAEDCILHRSFLDWAPTYSGPKFNLIHCDFPYGVSVFDGGQMGPKDSEAYADSEDVYWSLLECLCLNLDRVMSVVGHLLFWYSAKHHTRTMETFRTLAPSLAFQTHPLIWFKSDNAGMVTDHRRSPRHVYETCLMASRGNQHIVKVVADLYSAPTDKRFHVSTKPEPMLKHFMSMLVDQNTRVLDPTCGAASALRAAEDLGASQVLGMDIDQKCAEIARMTLRNSRSLRSASQASQTSQGVI